MELYEVIGKEGIVGYVDKGGRKEADIFHTNIYMLYIAHKKGCLKPISFEAKDAVLKMIVDCFEKEDLKNDNNTTYNYFGLEGYSEEADNQWKSGDMVFVPKKIADIENVFKDMVPITFNYGEMKEKLQNVIQRLDLSDKTKKKIESNLPYVNNTKEPIIKPIRNQKIQEAIEDSPEYKEYYRRWQLPLSHNLIISGPPGGGKSWLTKHNILPFLTGFEDSKEMDDYYRRVVFTPGIMYEDFFGCYKPVTEKDAIKYKFVPGIFADILLKAVCNRCHSYVLVIEEVNRAQVYEVFGLLFQLLDRKANQCSENPVEIPADVKGSEWDVSMRVELTLKDDESLKIFLPENLFIVCTMNPADQGVNVLDTAFLRRFSMAYIDVDGKLWCSKHAPIDFEKLETEKAQEQKVNKDGAGVQDTGTASESDQKTKYFTGHLNNGDINEGKVEELYKNLREIINHKLCKMENMTDDKLISEHFIKNRKDDMEVVMGLCYYLSTIFRTPKELGTVLKENRIKGVLESYQKDGFKDKAIEAILDQGIIDDWRKKKVESK